MVKAQLFLKNFTQYSPDYSEPDSFARSVTTLAEFETVEAAYTRGTYDWCLYHALHMLSLNPGNSYLISRIGAVLVHVSDIKKNKPELLTRFVSRYTGEYSLEARIINNFLHNLTVNETDEIAYHFLENPEHFDSKNPSHYYLLWRVAKVTKRKDVAENMKKRFQELFQHEISDFSITKGFDQ